ncbi:MAG: tRNA lysidine(34) synthetase TilS [Candidatus Omnitrophota bacterium]
MQIEEKFKNTISKYGLLKEKDKIIVAVSGGPDSVCLLMLLNFIKRNFNLSLHIATFNHLIRKKDAQRDVEFVKQIAAQLNLPFTVGEADVPKFAESKKLSLEEAARMARFGFLRETALKNNANKIALGHNSDDQVETFLMYLIRGAGLKGLSGMAVTRKEGSVDLIRPLIEIPRKEIELFLKQKRLKCRIDKTNKDVDYRRNKIRLKLIPCLEKEYNPAIREVILRTAHGIKEADDFIDKQTIAEAQKCVSKKNGRIVLELKDLKNKPWIIKTGVLRKSVLAVKGNLRQITYENLLALYKLAFELQSGKVISLPGEIIVKKIYDTLVFEKEGEDRKSLFAGKIELKCPGVTVADELGIKISAHISSYRPHFRNKPRWIEFFDADKIAGTVFVRARKEKDEFIPIGMRGKKSLKEFLIDEKVPFIERDKLPVFEDARRIIWVGGMRLSEEVKVEKNTKRVLKLEIIPISRAHSAVGFKKKTSSL